VNAADRIARERLRSQQEEARAEEVRRTSDAAAEARSQLDVIQDLSGQVLALLEASHYIHPKPDALSLSVFRFPPLGNLLGCRKIVKGGWKIAEWKYDREKLGHTVWLLADGRYCWNSQIVTLSRFADWHQSPYVSQGPPLMARGLSDLKKQVETSLATQSKDHPLRSSA
jgi:hypothetical protein